MNKNQIIHLISFIVAWLILATLPMFIDIYHLLLYYAIAIWLLFFGLYWITQYKKVDERFYKKWHKLREKGFWFNVVRQGIYSSIYLIVIVVLGQFWGNDITPNELIALLSDGIIWIILLIVVFGFLIGVITWYGNEKRYRKIYYKMK